MQRANTDLAIGIDLGATKIAAALVSAQGVALVERQVATRPEREAPAVLDDMAGLVDELAQAARPLGGRLLGIGVGSPGQVDALDGVVYNAVNLGWREVHLAAELRRRSRREVPVWIHKDAGAAAVGEYFFGAAQGCRNFILLTVGSGLGGGVMAGGVLLSGATWNGAEPGHLSLDPDHGSLCNCGRRGCAETIVSGPGLVAAAARMAAETGAGFLNGGKITPARVLEAARNGDKAALAALLGVGAGLGRVAAAGLAFLNPQRLVIGGGLGLAAFEWIVPAARVEIERRVLPACYQTLQIVPSRAPSSAIGAASLVWYGLYGGAWKQTGS